MCASYTSAARERLSRITHRGRIAHPASSIAQPVGSPTRSHAPDALPATCCTRRATPTRSCHSSARAAYPEYRPPLGESAQSPSDSASRPRESRHGRHRPRGLTCAVRARPIAVEGVLHDDIWMEVRVPAVLTRTLSKRKGAACWAEAQARRAARRGKYELEHNPLLSAQVLFLSMTEAQGAPSAPEACPPVPSPSSKMAAAKKRKQDQPHSGAGLSCSEEEDDEEALTDRFQISAATAAHFGPKDEPAVASAGRNDAAALKRKKPKSTRQSSPPPPPPSSLLPPTLVWGVAESQGKRPYMEDRYSVVELGRLDARLHNVQYLSVLDGHGGQHCVDFANEQLPTRLSAALLAEVSPDAPPDAAGPSAPPDVAGDPALTHAAATDDDTPPDAIEALAPALPTTAQNEGASASLVSPANGWAPKRRSLLDEGPPSSAEGAPVSGAAVEAPADEDAQEERVGAAWVPPPPPAWIGVAGGGGGPDGGDGKNGLGSGGVDAASDGVAYRSLSSLPTRPEPTAAIPSKVAAPAAGAPSQPGARPPDASLPDAPPLDAPTTAPTLPAVTTSTAATSTVLMTSDAISSLPPACLPLQTPACPSSASARSAGVPVSPFPSAPDDAVGRAFTSAFSSVDRDFLGMARANKWGGA